MEEARKRIKFHAQNAGFDWSKDKTANNMVFSLGHKID